MSDELDDKPNPGAEAAPATEAPPVDDAAESAVE